ncbi:MAG: hypothetical protein ABSB00_00715 [Minisyncoccia bacterium]|jgi:hypothetical protein
MSEDGGDGDGSIVKVPPRREIPHYHGDAVRALFVIGALVLIIGQSTGAELPLSSTGAVISAVILVVAAGITNPTQSWIHWINALLAIIGTLLFGTAAVAHYRAGLSFFDLSFVFIEALMLLSLMALYFTTRTIRGIFLRSDFS